MRVKLDSVAQLSSALYPFESNLPDGLGETWPKCWTLDDKRAPSRETFCGASGASTLTRDQLNSRQSPVFTASFGFSSCGLAEYERNSCQFLFGSRVYRIDVRKKKKISFLEKKLLSVCFRPGRS